MPKPGHRPNGHLGHAILLRNPHLAWTAGYYEAHLTVPGVVDFYGDFRIGGPFGVIGGFNRDLGWATTNSNSGDLTEIYAVAADPAHPDRYVLDGDELVWDRAFGRPRNAVVLPAGWTVVASSTPGTVSQDPDGRQRLYFENNRNDEIQVLIRARRIAQ